MISASDCGTLEQLKELSSKRKAIEDSINESTFITEAIAREMSGGLTSRCEQVIDSSSITYYFEEASFEFLDFLICWETSSGYSKGGKLFAPVGEPDSSHHF